MHGRRLHRHLGDAARAWRATREDPSELYRGTRLDAALDWAGTHPADLNEAEQAFLDAGRQQAEHEVADARRRAAEKARANRRLRALLGGVAALLVVALVSGLLFLRQRNQAEQASLETRARELAGLATLAIDEDPERAILLGLAAAERTNEPSAELLSALHRAAQSTVLTSRIDGVMNVSMDQSPDGSLLAVDRLDVNGYRLIDTASGGTVADVATDYEISGLAFDPTGSTLAVAYGNPEDESVPAVEFFDVASSQPVRSLTGPAGYYCCSLQYDPTGRWLGMLLVDANERASAVVWDVTAGGSPKLFGPAYDFELGRDGTSIVVGDGTRLAVLDIATGEPIREIDTPPGVEYWDFEIDPTGKLAALVSTLARRVDVIDMETAEVRGTLELRDPLFAQFSPDGGVLAITAEDGLIRLYDTDDFVERERLAGTSGAPLQIFFAPDGSRVLSARTGEIRTWDISPGAPRVLGNFHVSGGLLDRLVVAADESVAYATVHTNAGDISSLHRVDLRSGVDDEVLGDVRYYFSTRPLVSPDLSVVAALDEAYVTQLVQRPGGDSTPLERCESVRAFDRNGRVAALDAFLLCTERGQEPGGGSRIVDLETGRTLLDLGDTVIYAAAFGPPGDDGLPRSAIVVDRDSAAVTLYDLATGAAVGTYLPDAGEFPQSLAMSPDGRRLALLMDSGRLIVLDVERIQEGDDQTDAKVVDIVAHGAGSKAIDVSHSGLIATGSSADGVRIWSRDGELLASVPTHQQDPPTFTFAPGTDTLYYEDGGGVVRRFAIDLDDVTRLARSVLTRGFTPQECARYFPDEPCPTFDIRP